MNRHDADALDRHITGNYGEDQFRDEVESDEARLCGKFHSGPCEAECEGHESTSGPIGNVIYCDGNCKPQPAPKICPTRTPEVHQLGEFPMTCYRCHLEADS